MISIKISLHALTCHCFFKCERRREEGTGNAARSMPLSLSQAAVPSRIYLLRPGQDDMTTQVMYSPRINVNKGG